MHPISWRAAGSAALTLQRPLLAGGVQFVLSAASLQPELNLLRSEELNTRSFSLGYLRLCLDA